MVSGSERTPNQRGTYLKYPFIACSIQRGMTPPPSLLPNKFLTFLYQGVNFNWPRLVRCHRGARRARSRALYSALRRLRQHLWGDAGRVRSEAERGESAGGVSPPRDGGEIANFALTGQKRLKSG
jgi:hypothetical protein